MHDSFKALLSLIIPEGVSDYFKLAEHTNEAGAIHLEEMNMNPVEYQFNKLQSKGFFDAIVLQDFPMRGRRFFCMLNVGGGLICRPIK
ncbi:MAG: transposase family protein [Daejeonella sp.]|nr:transposase family protein [Daejeonella sp.]